MEIINESSAHTASSITKLLQMYRNEALKIDPMNAEVFWCHIIPGDPYGLFPVPGAGFGKGQAAVELAPLETGCELRYAVKSTIGGKLAQIGQRLIDAAAKSLAEDFFKRFEAVLRERTGQAGG